MTIEMLIYEIVSLAKEKFQVSEDHLNDCMSVGIYHIGGDEFSVYLERPTIEELDNVYSNDDLLNNRTNMSTTMETHFYTEGNEGLLHLLEKLYASLDNAQMKRHESGRFIPIYGP